MISITDHLIAALLCLLVPVWGAWKFRRLKRAVTAGNREARGRAYLHATITQWVMLLAVLGWWNANRRPWSDLGLGVTLDARFLAGAAVCLVLTALFLVQARIIRGNRDAQAHVRENTANLAAIAPSTDRELKRFLVLSITAGVCEEILYRGFMLWYLTQGLETWLAVLVGAAVFGVGHGYQGAGGILKTAAVGLVTSVLFLWMRSVWGVVALHATIDICSGVILHCVSQNTEPAGRRETPAEP